MVAPRPRLAQRSARASVAAFAVAALTGCQGVYDLPLPGGAAGGDDVMRVTAEFADVLDLVPQSAVKVNEVTVGAVEKIELHGWTAKVTLRIPDGTKLPDNATAELKQTSLLGEKYVELAAPTATAPQGALGDGDNIPLDRTSRNPEVEEVLSAMSLLLNGGGVAQLKVIESELNNAMRGREKDIKSLIGQLDTFVGGLDEQKAEIVRAIDNLDRLSGRIAAQKNVLATAVQELPKGLAILADQREQLTIMLQHLSRLGAVGTKVIRGSRADLDANLRALQPILTQLAKAGDALPRSMELLLTYPFPDSAMNAIKGDYTNLHITADLDLRNLVTVLPTGLPTDLPSVLPTGLPTALPTGLPTALPTALPTGTPSLPVCPPICLSSPAETASADQSWTSLYSGNAS